jgi:hypothetical protein
LSAARIQQHGTQEHWRPGIAYELSFGWQASESWALGGQLSSVLVSIDIEPVELYTLGPRLDYSPEFVGPIASATLGLALTRTETDERAGIGGGLRAGHRFRLGSYLTIAGYGGALAHWYPDGWAALPFGIVELRLHGP